MPDHTADIRALATELAGEPGALLPILHAIQGAFGYLPAPTTAQVADVLNLSRAEVHGVISFYHYFRASPPGAHTLAVCRSEACQAMGGNALLAHAQQRLATTVGQTSDDGLFTLNAVYCLGNCACAPAAMLDDMVYGRLTPERLDALLTR